jgi:hypothetical protein
MKLNTLFFEELKSHAPNAIIPIGGYDFERRDFARIGDMRSNASANIVVADANKAKRLTRIFR